MRTIVLLALFLVVGCSGSRISNVQNLPPLEHAVRVVALDPSGGAMADAIGIHLMGSGIRVVDTRQTTSMLQRVGLTEIEVIEPRALEALHDAGVDAVLAVNTQAGYDDQPESVSVRLVSATTGGMLAGTAWQNGRAGMAGSPADRMRRKGVVEAAEQIGAEIAKQLRRPVAGH